MGGGGLGWLLVRVLRLAGTKKKGVDTQTDRQTSYSIILLDICISTHMMVSMFLETR